jgi:hypothetical protein
VLGPGRAASSVVSAAFKDIPCGQARLEVRTLALPLFAITLFTSAFLLFLVQPMIGKTILPRLGGTPQVWNTCMVFFQMALLAGYAYTHTVSSRIKLRGQLILHGLLLLTPFLILLPFGPFNISTGLLGNWTPPPGANPIPSALFLLTIIVGLPFFVVATSAPLLQKWFASTGHPAAADPYFLYGASNLGSLLALIAYPAIIEPWVHLRGFDVDTGQTLFFSQPWIWTFGYVLLVVLFLVCVSLVWKTPATVKLAGHAAVQEAPPVKEEARVEVGIKAAATVGASARSTAIKKGSKQARNLMPRPTRKESAPPTAALDEAKRLEDVTPWRRLRWVMLAAVPSSLMLGITTYITTDLSPIPLFWLIPLTLYLLSFILVFSRWPVVWTGQPHQAMLVAQPVAVALMVVFLASHAASITFIIVANVVGFFLTTMVCHGELAKDRPSTKYLTEFYLWMSVGGMLGGMFNALVAPLLFVYVWEFPLAIFAGCMIRPTLKEGGWADTMFASLFAKPAPGSAHPRRPGHAVHHKHVEETPQLHYTMDIVLAGAVLVLGAFLIFVGRDQYGTPMLGQMLNNPTGGIVLSFAIPLAIACFYWGRPLRFGLAVGAVLLLQGMYESRGEQTIYADRSYFGILRVIQGRNEMGTYTKLMHATTDHGMNFRLPAEKKDWGNPDKDFSRLATTYYHRKGPAGIVMEKFNWFPGPENTYWADARMPTSIAGLGGDPMSQLVNLWSEPPYATIGLGTGTMASYCRPYQHMHFYEIDNHIKRLSEVVEAPDGRPCFTYVHDARARGGLVSILMGDARLKMAQPYVDEKGAQGGGPEDFYHMMVVDAFSSDAIPVHLITKEAIKMYFKHLTEKGILCVHTSNRHVDLVPVVADVADSLGFASLRGHDNSEEKDRGHYTSEWVMVARKADYLVGLHAPEGYNDRGDPYWKEPVVTGRHVWTDDFSNLMGVYREFTGNRRR